MSLKAELLRKQNEVNQAKSRQAANPFVPRSFEKPKPLPESKPASSSIKNAIELEDNEQLDRSRKILEAKSKFYDRMTASGGAVNTDDNCLVMFNAKKQAEKVAVSSSEESDSDDDKYDDEESEDWVEYTDSLGRTRKCLRSDLEFFKKRDETLARDFGDRKEEKVDSSPPRSLNNDKPQAEDDQSDSESEDELLKTGRQIQQMRDQWEQQESENKDKEFVHYQDVLFDGGLLNYFSSRTILILVFNSLPTEARTHGVSYFQFSKDAEERAKQQKELDSVRKATLTAQKDREEQRNARERIIAERVLAAKNRQRARLGLPPLEKVEVTEPSTVESSDEAAKKSAEPSEEEAMKELERKSHLRPWDEGKEGTSHLVPKKVAEEKEWEYKGHREPMSQGEWNEKKRDERNAEFAPTNALNKSPPKRHKKKQFGQDSPVKSNFTPSAAPSEEAVVEVEEEEEERPGLYFTTKKKLKRRNYQPEDTETSFPSSSGRGDGPEIPPPPTFDYYGPPLLGLSKKLKTDSGPALETSIEAGLKFLRNQTDKTQSTSKSMWGANVNYGKES